MTNSNAQNHTNTIPMMCPTCHTTLHIPAEITHVTCTHCATQHVVQQAGGIAYLQPLVAGATVSPTTLISHEHRLALQTQLEQLRAELAHLTAHPPHEGLAGKKIGLGLFAISIGLVLLTVVVAVGGGWATPTLWQGLLGGAVVAAALGVIFYGDGRRTYRDAHMRHQKRIETLRDLQRAGEAELARLAQPE